MQEVQTDGTKGVAFHRHRPRPPTDCDSENKADAIGSDSTLGPFRDLSVNGTSSATSWGKMPSHEGSVGPSQEASGQTDNIH